jgi:carbamate kinase
MRLVVALGGNALLQRGEKPDAAVQRHHVRRAAKALAPLCGAHDVIICHGNGPQVGLLAAESEADSTLSEPYPLDVLVAQTQGMIGYWLAQELRNAGVQRPVAAIVTQTVVRADDPAFAHPTKFIGGSYPEPTARSLADLHGWAVARDGHLWRRVVASPQPTGFVEEAAVRSLVDTQAVVICGGGGGAPVAYVGDELAGVEAVVDKDQVAAMLAIRFDADRLLILTDVPAVMRDFGSPHQAPIASLTAGEVAAMTFPSGSMGPKVDACLAFTTASGRTSAIGSLEQAEAVLAGESGTTITGGTRDTELADLGLSPGVTHEA